MATAAQTRANQANAKKSTGPKTEQGKAKVAGNHITDGLFIRRHLILPSEDPTEYDALLADGKGEHQAALAECEWRIRRCQRAEAIHRREKLRLLGDRRKCPAETATQNHPTAHPGHFRLSPPFQCVAVTSNPIPPTPTPTITYGLPPRYVQELRQLKRTQSTIDPNRDQSHLSPPLRLYIKDRNHLAQARQFLKSVA
jgi:hypothetical protein